MKALIVGAGIGGMTAALLLARQGIDVSLCEKSETLRDGGAGLVLWSNATWVLGTLGLHKSLMSCSAQLNGGVVIDERGKEITSFSLEALAASKGGPVLGIRRSALMALLAERFPGDCIQFDRRLTHLTLETDRVRAKFATGDPLEADSLIGADGIQSAVRACLLGDRARYAGYVGYRGIARFSDHFTESNIARWYYGRGGQFGLIPVGEGEVFWFGTVNVSEDRLETVGDAKAHLMSRYGKWTDPIPAFIERLDDDSIIPTPIYDHRVTKLSCAGNATLLGDAAHAMTPTFGQGACLAIEGAYQLNKALSNNAQSVRGGTTASSLRLYEERHFPRAKSLVRGARLIGNFIQSEHRPICAFRDAVLRYSPPSLRQWMVEGMAGTIAAS